MRSNAELVRELLMQGAIRTARVRKAFEGTDRADFVPSGKKKHAYENWPLELEEGQTISQPLTVAIMTEALDVKQGHKVLEVGTGSGYQASILSLLTGEQGRVITTEVRKALHGFAARNLAGRKNVALAMADGSRGYEKEAPYDRIMVTARATRIREELLGQLKDGGILVIPVGDEMLVVRKKRNRQEKRMIGYFSFVPLVE